MRSRLDDEWDNPPGILPSGDALEGSRLGNLGGGPAVLAFDYAGNRHLLIASPQTPAEAFTPRRWAGLEVELVVLELGVSGQRHWFDFTCTDAAFSNVFRSLCADLLDELCVRNAATIRVVTEVLDTWAMFWNRDTGMTYKVELGLAGELLLIRDFLLPARSDWLEMWQGPSSGRHDFVSASTSIEVKTTSRSQGPTVHTFQSIHQLADPVGGELLLFSVALASDALGEITVQSLVNDIDSSCTPGSAPRFHRKLGDVGWSPSETYPGRWRRLHTDFYRVNADFPRLTPETISTPKAVIDVSYSLDMTACHEWLVHHEDIAAIISPDVAS